ncbi:HEPN domain-containing protein [Thermosyntropha sp.]|uniref:HEPN domain-containing protein n=1 Tax=Thermosyntropha sp. TaxID=2740820 RepID=UPI0025DFF5A0|nr:HEPN domain-containing protein [Thermosyntropha sp.]MBO8159056.1 HEPN domain-containing protein [Thermosyntropha sp.]
MVDSKKYEEWFKMAQKDMKGAKILYEHKGDNGIICFHCQQAIEKHLKGFLIKVTGELLEGHNLVKLCRKAAVYEKSLDRFLRDVAFVNAFYIETRYPADDPLEISRQDAEDCIKIAEEIIKKIEGLVK